MVETSLSLFDQLRNSSDPEAWGEFVDLYSPLIRKWLVGQAVRGHDLDDLTQEVMAVLTRKLPEFRRGSRVGSFRAWLRTITLNCLRNYWRKKKVPPKGGSSWQEQIRQLSDPDGDLSQRWDAQHDEHGLRKALDKVQPRFDSSTWQAFQLVAFDGLSAGAAAERLGTTPNAVCISKSRVLAALRQVVDGLIEL